MALTDIGVRDAKPKTRSYKICDGKVWIWRKDKDKG